MYSPTRRRFGKVRLSNDEKRYGANVQLQTKFPGYPLDLPSFSVKGVIMNRDIELELLQRCQSLCQEKTTTLANSVNTMDTERYRSNSRFKLEMEKLHKVKPLPIAHSSEITEADKALSRTTLLGNLIISRDNNGRALLFHNICRHRGATLIPTNQDFDHG